MPPTLPVLVGTLPPPGQHRAARSKTPVPSGKNRPIGPTWSPGRSAHQDAADHSP